MLRNWKCAFSWTLRMLARAKRKTVAKDRLLLWTLPPRGFVVSSAGLPIFAVIFLRIAFRRLGGDLGATGCFTDRLTFPLMQTLGKYLVSCASIAIQLLPTWTLNLDSRVCLCLLRHAPTACGMARILLN